MCSFHILSLPRRRHPLGFERTGLGTFFAQTQGFVTDASGKVHDAAGRA
jgi:hypothetical protein